MTRTREWLLYNAVEAWLVNYGNQPTETVEQYKQLRDELHDTFIASIQPKDASTTKPRKRTNANKPAKTL
jgi:pyruvate/oxaloacetate carboxyltransferase